MVHCCLLQDAADRVIQDATMNVIWAWSDVVPTVQPNGGVVLAEHGVTDWGAAQLNFMTGAQVWGDGAGLVWGWAGVEWGGGPLCMNMAWHPAPGPAFLVQRIRMGGREKATTATSIANRHLHGCVVAMAHGQGWAGAGEQGKATSSTCMQAPSPGGGFLIFPLLCYPSILCLPAPLMPVSLGLILVFFLYPL